MKNGGHADRDGCMYAFVALVATGLGTLGALGYGLFEAGKAILG